MAEPRPRRGHGEDSIYFDQAHNHWVGAVSLGYKAGKRARKTVTGRTKTAVKAKLRQLRQEPDNGVRSSATYMVGNALDDWLTSGLSGRSDRTTELYRDTVKPPSKSLTLAQAQTLLEASRNSRLHAYVVLSVMTGLRTEELRALRWTEVGLEAGAVAVYRSARVTGDAKTRKSRSVLGQPQLAMPALREHHKLQVADRLKAGALWQDHGLVFASSIGTPLDRHNVLREFRKITAAAGLGIGWVPRELRHAFVSQLVPPDGRATSPDIALQGIQQLLYGASPTPPCSPKVIGPRNSSDTRSPLAPNVR